MGLRSGAELNHRDKVAKIRALAERGATEGERAAARAALDRMGEPLKDPRSRPGAYFNYDPPTPQPRTYAEANRQYQFFYDEAISSVTKMFNEFTEKFMKMRAAGFTDVEITEMVHNGTFMSWEESN